MFLRKRPNRHQLTLIFKKAMNKNLLIEVLGDKFQVNIVREAILRFQFLFIKKY